MADPDPRLLEPGPFNAEILGSDLSFVIPADRETWLDQYEPGLIMLRWSDAGEDMTLTLLTLEQWGLPLKPTEQWDGRRPDSLAEWLAANDGERADFRPFRPLSDAVEAEYWFVRADPAQLDSLSCPSIGSCGTIASSPTGATIGLRADMVNDLVALTPPTGPPVLAHIPHIEGAPQTLEPQFAELLSTITFEQ